MTFNKPEQDKKLKIIGDVSKFCAQEPIAEVYPKTPNVFLPKKVNYR